MALSDVFNKAKDAATQGLAKAREVAGDNPEKVRDGLTKAQAFVDQKTGGKYSEAVAKGKEGISHALGVAANAKDHLKAEMHKDVKVDPVEASDIDPPAPINDPKPVN